MARFRIMSGEEALRLEEWSVLEAFCFMAMLVLIEMENRIARLVSALSRDAISLAKKIMSEVGKEVWIPLI